MPTTQERILLVESDPEISDLIARQTLQPVGFRVSVVGAANQAIQEAMRFAPDVIIANLSLPGLSGKDLLVALASQGLEAPVIVLAQKGMEGDVIQSFRLGAADYLLWPVREAEVISAVERALKQVRARREREALGRQLNQTNQELQKRVRELTTIFAIGKAVTSITDQLALFDKIVEGAIYVTEADCGWFLVKDEREKAFVLGAYRNLPKNVTARLGQPWDDGISSLVALSGETLAIHGEPLKRFKVARLGQSALVLPVKVKNEVVGLLVVIRRNPQPFGASNQALLEAVADYASISLVNARLFKALEERAKSLQQTAESAEVDTRIKDDLLQAVNKKFSDLLALAVSQLDLLLGEEKRGLNAEQVRSLRLANDSLKQLKEIVESAKAMQQPAETAPRQRGSVNLNEVVKQAITRYQPLAQLGNVTFVTELSTTPVQANANTDQINKVLDGLLSNAIKFSPNGGQVTIRTELTSDRQAHVAVQDHGIGIDEKHLAHIFERFYKVEKTDPSARRFGGLGIGLALVKEVVLAHNGKIWVESQIGKGSTFHFTLPASG
jgi:signal transduction histidine kinase/DNA-binding response OmpR family regulator